MLGDKRTSLGREFHSQETSTERSLFLVPTILASDTAGIQRRPSAVVLRGFADICRTRWSLYGTRIYTFTFALRTTIEFSLLLLLICVSLLQCYIYDWCLYLPVLNYVWIGIDCVLIYCKLHKGTVVLQKVSMHVSERVKAAAFETIQKLLQNMLVGIRKKVHNMAVV